MKKIKLLYDVGLLATVPPDRRSGVYRMTETILHYLDSYPAVDVYPCLWTKNKYLSERLDAIGLGHLKKRIVSLPLFRYFSDDLNWLRRLKGIFLSRCGRILYRQKLKQFDCLFESFLRVPDMMYQSSLPVIGFVHDLIPILYPDYVDSNFARSYQKWMKNIQSDIVFCDSEHTKKDFLKYRSDYDPHHVKVAYLGVEDKFYPVALENDSFSPEAHQAQILNSKGRKHLQDVLACYGLTNSRYIFALSAESKRKNFMHLMQAFKRFITQEGINDLRLVIGGPRTKQLESFLENNPELGSKIVLLGFVDENDLPALYQGADCFVYPSLYEGFGLPVLEAMACGTPVICGHNSSLVEVCKEAAMYVSGNNIQETVNALFYLYYHPEIRKEMREQGIKRARDFKWETTAEKIYSQIIKTCINKGEA